ncbi:MULTISPECIES: class F sortase [unclassified Streptomyces]|uniref:class F sortase n=1 Tax=unclassified Streptomyces TaxID=2593676 RepID=UPI00081EFB8A|nr:class F sortase [Streptomyces sp. LcepLS]MYR28384.1 class F sortase [Streptomyces sp. SID4945]SCF37077.1 Sortase family protein [Streptomyces sp. LcepLS]
MLTALGCALLAAGAVALGTGLAGQDQDPAPPGIVAHPSPGSPSPGTPSATPSPSTSATAPPPVLPAARPTRLTIPSLKVSTSLERLRLDEHKALTPPRDPDEAGWYAQGAAPGARGPAVIAGHVTWNGAKAVFFDLARLRPGARVEVRRSDGTTAVFRVTRLTQYAKDRFPSLEVYGNTPGAELRLITCGGKYSGSAHHYSDNVVVYAKLLNDADAT